MPVDPLSPAAALLAGCAVVIGVSKTSIGGIAVLAVAAFATVMPAKESTAAVLALLIVGDLAAVTRHRGTGDWSLLRKLLPSVLPGVAVGAAFLHVVDDHTLRRAIGAILTITVAMQLWRRVRRGAAEDRTVRTPRLLAAVAAGTAAGFTTMTANAGGPVMTLYLLAARVDKRAFVRMNAVFFLLVNLVKTPFSAARPVPRRHDGPDGHAGPLCPGRGLARDDNRRPGVTGSIRPVGTCGVRRRGRRTLCRLSSETNHVM